jgi:hypothetical protein
MAEHSIQIPIALLLPLGGAIVAVLGWFFTLRGRIEVLEGRLTALGTAQGAIQSEMSTRLSALATADQALTTRLDEKKRRLDLCEERHATFVQQYRRDMHRVASDITIATRIERLRRSQQGGQVIAFTDVEEDAG